MPREPSAAPFHDWNARIHAECYRANAFARIHDSAGRIEAIVNNYDRISFNFGPTLARWLGRHDPGVEGRLRDGGRRAAAAPGPRRRGGAGVRASDRSAVQRRAIARTQLVWGLHDFRRRFGRAAEGMWLPETAVSPATLETLIELGVRYTILAPEQIAAVRPLGGDEWTAVNRDTLDTGRGYLWRHRDGSGRTHRARRVRRAAVARGRVRRDRQPRREPAGRGPGLGRSVPGRAASGWCCAPPTASCGATTRSSRT